MDNAAFRASVRKILAMGQGLAESLGTRPVEVVIRVRDYSAAIGAHTATPNATTDTVLSPRPAVRALSTRENDDGVITGPMTDATGRPLILRYGIDPIVLPFTGGGYDPEAVVPQNTTTRRVTVLLRGEGFGADGEEFEVVRRETSAMSTKLVVERTRQGA